METGTLWELVGRTPLIKIESLSKMTGCHIYGKAEFLNPGGSVKDRAAKSMITEAEASGQLKPGGIIVEGTAGNTGIGLATLAADRGYRVILTMPDNQSEEKYQTLESLGADIRKVPPVPFANENHFYHQARIIAEQTPGAVWVNQFENLANAKAHYETTGPEIWQQTGGKVDVFVTAVGTGGTLGGISRFLKEKCPKTRTMAADPLGSGVYCLIKETRMETTGSSVTEGIGIMRITANFQYGRVDDAIRITDQQMIDMLYHLARHDGLLVGTSAALNVRAAYELALQNRGSGQTIVTILCDHGSRYYSRVFNANWLREKGLQPSSLTSSLSHLDTSQV